MPILVDNIIDYQFDMISKIYLSYMLYKSKYCRVFYVRLTTPGDIAFEWLPSATNAVM